MDVSFLVFEVFLLRSFAELQLKSEHKPIQHLNDWKRKIVGLLTESDPSREDPQIFWRRDAILSIAEEKDVSRLLMDQSRLLICQLYHAN